MYIKHFQHSAGEETVIQQKTAGIKMLNSLISEIALEL